MHRLRIVILFAMLAALSLTDTRAAQPQLYTIPPGAPKVLLIPRIGVNATVESVKMTNRAAEHAPFKWSDVAWYSNGPRPGDTGRAEIYGHLDSTCCPAVFWYLHNLVKGDPVQVQYGDGRKLTFIVQWGHEYWNNQLPFKFMDAPTQERGLVLLTCAGVFHTDGSGYDHKYVVYAKLSIPAGHYLPPPLREPDGVAVARNGNVIVADTGNDRVREFAKTGELIGDWGTSGTGAGQFASPAAVALDSAGNIYVADSGNNRIQKLSPDGQPLAQWGTEGSDAGQFKNPNGVAVGGMGNIFVADSRNGRVQELSPTGDPLHSWTTATPGGASFSWPDGIAVDSQGYIYVADAWAGRIDVLNPDGTPKISWHVHYKVRVVTKTTTKPPSKATSSKGKSKGKGKSKSKPKPKPTKVTYKTISVAPEGVAVDNTGHVFVVGTGQDFVLMYGTSGRFIRMFGKTGDGPGRLFAPGGVGVGRGGYVYVADSGNNRIEEMSQTGKPIKIWR